MNNRKRRRVMAPLPVGTGSARPRQPAIHSVKQTDASDALEVAVVWLDRIARGLDEQGQLEFRVWLDADEMHRKVLFEMAQIYDELNVLSASPTWTGGAVAPVDVGASEKLM
jgi:ferric-dicitrate binding protein FerR (iron transport regulator)